MQTNHHFQKRIDIISTYVILGFYSTFILVPIVWVISSSFKNKIDMADYSKIFFFRVTLENYITLFRIRNFDLLFRNSLLVTSVSTAIILPLGFAAAYALARWPYRGKDSLTLGILATRMLPPVALTLPIYIMFSFLRLINTLHGLIMAYVAFGLPFSIMVLKSYIEGVPREYDESAQIDGCGVWGAVFRVILPACGPGFATAALFSALNAWSEFLFAMILSSTQSAQTATVGTAGLISALGIEWGPLLAASTLLIVPMVILVIVAQRRLIEGLMTGIK